jgi:hypothetical protein
MRLPNAAHQSHAWRITEVAPDFRLEDAWALPAQGDADDFATLLEIMASLDPANGPSRLTRALFRIRYLIGGWFGWDDAAGRQLPIPGNAETALSARLPEDLRGTAEGLVLGSTSFTPLYRTDVEWAAELSNQTVHAVLHLAWVDQGDDRERGQMGVYVKPRGGLGAAYMALIAPFRHLIVYPALMRQIEHAWNVRMVQRTSAYRHDAGVGSAQPHAAEGSGRTLIVNEPKIGGRSTVRLQGKQWLILGGSLSIAIALLHIAIIFGGAPAYRYFGAGEEMAERAAAGSALPALLTLILAVIFTVWGLYAFSGAGLIRHLPLLRLGLAVIAGIYTLRGIGVVPQLFWMIVSPQAVAPQEVVFSLASLFVGIAYLVGTISIWKRLPASRQTAEHRNQ